MRRALYHTFPVRTLAFSQKISENIYIPLLFIGQNIFLGFAAMWHFSKFLNGQYRNKCWQKMIWPKKTTSRKELFQPNNPIFLHSHRTSRRPQHTFYVSPTSSIFDMKVPFLKTTSFRGSIGQQQFDQRLASLIAWPTVSLSLSLSNNNRMGMAF